jgi:hypothetical protein
MSAAIAIRDNRDAFEPQSTRDALELCRTLVASRFLPESIRTPEAAFAILATGRELGLTAMQSMRSIHIIKGKPTLSADLIVGLCKRAPSCEFFQLVESSGKVARYETKRVGEKPTVLEYTIEEAKQAGLLSNDNWRKYPAAMLRARCASALARAVYPDVAMGLYDPDELGASVEVEESIPANAQSVEPPIVTVDWLTEQLGKMPPEDIGALVKVHLSADEQSAFRRIYKEWQNSKRPFVEVPQFEVPYSIATEPTAGAEAVDGAGAG